MNATEATSAGDAAHKPHVILAPVMVRSRASPNSGAPHAARTSSRNTVPATDVRMHSAIHNHTIARPRSRVTTADHFTRSTTVPSPAVRFRTVPLAPVATITSRVTFPNTGARETAMCSSRKCRPRRQLRDGLRQTACDPGACAAFELRRAGQLLAGHAERPQRDPDHASVAHERDGWMWLSAEEKRELDVDAPALLALLVLDAGDALSE
jgi:hypothetical protein